MPHVDAQRNEGHVDSSMKQSLDGSEISSQKTDCDDDQESEIIHHYIYVQFEIHHRTKPGKVWQIDKFCGIKVESGVVVGDVLHQKMSVGTSIQGHVLDDGIRTAHRQVGIEGDEVGCREDSGPTRR